ncbi:hypothetical protein JTE90_002211 [Oedothorax gibbosus]|uniref:Uncharacterized protein n=1 Tax=Oedothorax gibbosus TaxID=931172 RepID=A0AAV6VGH0_9ARAC|nr:hypothetical protein JTE90_002211 [Oedothorax gibbosus]
MLSEEDNIACFENMMTTKGNCIFKNSDVYETNSNRVLRNSDVYEMEDNQDVNNSDVYNTKADKAVCFAKDDRALIDSDVYNTGDEKATKTSDVYKTENLPFRFEHPSKWNYDSGNCVFNASQEVFKKYSDEEEGRQLSFGDVSSSARKTHPLFRTTNSDYGSQPPCVHTVPLTYHPRRYKHWEHLASFGMYRNRGFNTAIDRSRV